MSKSVSSIAEEYLYSINPLAQRIGEDVTATKEAYEGLWNALSTAEKNQAIDETIIQPEVALKYTLKNVESSKDSAPDWYPKLRIQTGLKYVIDETGSTLRWRDEHSGPFSFMTQSQMNLNLSDSPDSPNAKTVGSYMAEPSRFSSPRVEGSSSTESSLDDYSLPSNQHNFYQSDSYSDSVFKSADSGHILNNCITNENTGSIFTKLMNKTSLLKMPNGGAIDDDDDDDTESLVPHKNVVVRSAQKNGNGNRNQMNINLNGPRGKSVDVNESTALLETPSSYSSFQSSQTNQEDGIPKTGFEFLDNW